MLTKPQIQELAFPECFCFFSGNSITFQMSVRLAGFFGITIHYSLNFTSNCWFIGIWYLSGVFVVVIDTFTLISQSPKKNNFYWKISTGGNATFIAFSYIKYRIGNTCFWIWTYLNLLLDIKSLSGQLCFTFCCYRTKYTRALELLSPSTKVFLCPVLAIFIPVLLQWTLWLLCYLQRL